MEQGKNYNGNRQDQGKPELPGLPTYRMEARHQSKGKENIREHIGPDAPVNPFSQERPQANNHH
jgi:hypothetical protein